MVEMAATIYDPTHSLELLRRFLWSLFTTRYHRMMMRITLMISIITDDFFLGAGVRSFVVIGQVLDWQYSHRHVLVK